MVKYEDDASIVKPIADELIYNIILSPALAPMLKGNVVGRANVPIAATVACIGLAAGVANEPDILGWLYCVEYVISVDVAAAVLTVYAAEKK